MSPPPSSSSSSPGGLQPGAVVAGRYRVVEVLGRGGQGSVARAIDEELHRNVALKVIGDDAAGRLARREGRALAAVRSPHVVGVFDVRDGDDGGPALLVLEFVTGMSLRRTLDERSLTVEEVVAVALGAIEGLTAAATAGVHHRDIKPDNIMVRGAASSSTAPITMSSICLVDFGLASSGGDPRTDSVVFAGSPAWLAPERAGGDARRVDDALADAYSLGVVMLEALLGANPFAAPTVAQTLLRHERDIPPSATLGRAPGEVDDIVARVVAGLLEKDPARRLGLIDARATLLARQPDEPDHARPTTTTTAATTSTTRTTRTTARRAGLVSMIAAAATAVAAIVGLAVDAGPPQPTPAGSGLVTSTTGPDAVLPPTPTTAPDVLATSRLLADAGSPPAPTAPKPHPRWTARPPTTTPTAPPGTMTAPRLPTPWPTGLAGRRRLLLERCADLPCATVATAPVPDDLTLLSANKASVDACLARCAGP